MRLQRLTSLEVQKIIDELKEVLALIDHLKDLLSSEQKILGVVKEETQEISKKFGDDRRTEIIEEEAEEINVEDLITEEDMVDPHFEPRLHQADPRHRLPTPGQGRQGLLLRASQGGRFHRAVLRGLHPRLRAFHHQPGQGVLGESARDPRKQPAGKGPEHQGPPFAGQRGGDHRGREPAQLHRRAVRAHGHPTGRREEGRNLRFHQRTDPGHRGDQARPGRQPRARRCSPRARTRSSS